MKTEDNYRIKIEEWTEQVEVFTVPIKHKNFLVQKRYKAKNWLSRVLLNDHTIWYTQSVHANLDEAILQMRNLHNRENPTIKYYRSTLL